MARSVPRRSAPEGFTLLTPAKFKFFAYIYHPFFILLSLYWMWRVPCVECVSVTVALGEIVLGLVVVCFAGLSWMLFKHSRSKLFLSDRGVELIPWRGKKVTLLWDEIVSVKNLYGGPGLLLSDGAEKKIRILPGAERFFELQRWVLQEWGSRQPFPTLPREFRSFPGRSLRLDRTSIQLKTLFSSRTISWEKIRSIEWGADYWINPDSRIPYLGIWTRDGRCSRISGWGGQLPQIFVYLKRIQDRGYFKKSDRRNFWREAPLAGNLKWAVLAGISWALLPGLYFGKMIITGKMAGLGLWAAGYVVLLIGIAVPVLKMFYRRTTPQSEPTPREEVHFLAGACLIVLCFLSAFLFCRLAVAGWGQLRMEKVKGEIIAAGYDMKIPDNRPRLKERENAVQDLIQASRTSSAKGLVWINDQNSAYRDLFWGKKTQSETLSAIVRDMASGKWSPDDQAQALRLLMLHQDSIACLETAYRKGRVDWGTDFSIRPAWRIEEPTYPCLTTWAEIFLCKAYLHAHQGHGRAALHHLKVALFLGDAAARSGFVFGSTLQASIYRKILGATPFILSEVDPQIARREFLPELKPKDMLDGFHRAVQIEIFGMESGLLNSYTMRLYRDFSRADYFECQLHALQAWELKYSDQKRATEQAESEYKNKIWFDWLSSRDRFWMQSRMLEVVADCRMSKAFVEARLFQQQHGRWPTKVDELPKEKSDDYTDPFADNAPLQIAQTSKGIRLSSLGPDEGDKTKGTGGRRRITWDVQETSAPLQSNP